MIPKIIHYCWFGKSEHSDLMETCISSWHKFLPDFQIIEWNEDKINIESEIPYVKDAYICKKYAFVSDYVRLKVLYEYGGIYFDTDYELLQPLSELLKTGNLITGFESKGNLLTAMIASSKNNEIIQKFLEQYRHRIFEKTDGSYDTTPINIGFSKLLSQYGVDLNLNEYQNIENDIVIYPIDVLCGFDINNWHEKVTNQTYGVHHMCNSWASDTTKLHIKRIQFWQKILGIRMYDKIKGLLSYFDLL